MATTSQKLSRIPGIFMSFVKSMEYRDFAALLCSDFHFFLSAKVRWELKAVLWTLRQVHSKK